MSSDGHIYLVKNPSLVVGIKESFFTRREGQHVHLQALDKNIKERKEQRWDFVVPSYKRSSTINNPIDSLKRTISGASLGSFSTSSSSTHTGNFSFFFITIRDNMISNYNFLYRRRWLS